MSFTLKPNNKKSLEYIIKDVEFERNICDADTPVYQAASSVQETYIEVVHKQSGNTKKFKNKTEFFGHWKTRNGGWLRKTNDDRIKKGKEPFDPDDFEIEEGTVLSPKIKNHVKEAVTVFDMFVGKLKRMVKTEDYLICISGSGNFRYDIANILPYKGNRGPKPLVLQEVKEAIIDKYSKKVNVSNGEEADDVLGQYGWENYKHYKKTGKWRDILSYVDKDLDMIISPSINYMKPEQGITYTSPELAASVFCKQLLSGDKTTDNIPGLPNFTEEIVKKYQTRKTKGVGKATANDFIDQCDSVKDMFQRVTDAYRSYYGDEYSFTTHRGENVTWSWLDFLKENAILLWMRRTPNEIYDIEATLKKLGIKV